MRQNESSEYTKIPDDLENKLSFEMEEIKEQYEGLNICGKNFKMSRSGEVIYNVSIFTWELKSIDKSL